MKQFCLFILIIVAASMPATAGTITAYSTAVMDDSPIAYWQFDDATCASGDIAADSTTNGHDMVCKTTGTVAIGFTNSTAGAGIGSQALVLPAGSDAAGNIGWLETVGSGGTHLGAFGSTASAGSTVEFWINTTTTAQSRIFSTFASADRTSMNMMLNTGNSFQAVTGFTELQYRTSDSKEFLAYFDQSDANIYDGQWHHVVWTFDAVNDDPEMSVYVDGAPVTVNETKSVSGTVAQGNFDNPVRLGAGGYDTLFTGVSWVQYGEIMLDEMAIYSSKLSSGQIQEHYSAAASVPEPSTIALVLSMLGAVVMFRRK